MASPEHSHLAIQFKAKRETSFDGGLQVIVTSVAVGGKGFVDAR
jgi:hypothetical protein